MIERSSENGFQTTFWFYSGLNLNQDKATKPQTVQIVRQGEATPYWFKVNPLYWKPEIFWAYKSICFIFVYRSTYPPQLFY
ncbi:hypothetical protein NEIMUCOT_05964 [Neisseria mucosa ATCC 25996]|uniref:Uncharacterized protein n=1 Tax=Neisseria mucosa (strain ATCC 25996 / DSM 4631 / NCTC 10774 / M26) TaxID=546266 RepID=D2ZZ90_NEIM2|nr:hypothetical protein NEIMUCOT_05964 [Neisseria mucosa ATCC 25996]